MQYTIDDFINAYPLVYQLDNFGKCTNHAPDGTKIGSVTATNRHENQAKKMGTSNQK